MTALSTSALSAAATLAITSPVAGLIRLELTAIDRVDPLVVDEQLGQLDLGPGRRGRNFRGHRCSSSRWEGSFHVSNRIVGRDAVKVKSPALPRTTIGTIIDWLDTGSDVPNALGLLLR